MRIDRIEVRSFLSHPHTVFEPGAARLVALVGPNGAGKSGLVSDAVRYVLFDDARARTDDLVALGETDMSVLLEFEYAGARYRATRGRSTKSGGRTFLELAIADGDGWTPLTGPTIRDTQASIGALLRLDPETFGTAVMLGQGDANRFAQATATERKRILAQVLGLEVYARAEARTREIARDAESRWEATRIRAERLEESLADFAGVRSALEAQRAQLATLEESMAEEAEGLAAARLRLAELRERVAAAQAVAGETVHLEVERSQAAADWRSASGRKASHLEALARAEALLADAATAAEAVTKIPEAAALVVQLEEVERQDREGRRALAVRREGLEALRQPYLEKRAVWTAEVTALGLREHHLVEAGKGGPAVCETCGQSIDADNILAQLKNVREIRREVIAAEPKEPLAIAREAAQIGMLETRIREAAFDPTALARAREILAGLERALPRAEAHNEILAAIERERLALDEAEADIARAEQRGTAARDRLVEIAAQAEAVRNDAVEAHARTVEISRLEERLDEEGRARITLERAIAAKEATVTRLEQMDAERTALDEEARGLAADLARLRKLQTAFGPGGIPARIIEGVLPELAGYANELLGELRPGMTLEMRAQRATRDGKGLIEALDLRVRDDIGERGLALFSGGERMSVSLALAAGLSRLIARRAGTAIRTLVVDEPDGLDADARRAFGQALRVLAHHGELERVILVSHHPDLADVGDVVYEVTKDGRGSVVTLVD